MPPMTSSYVYGPAGASSSFLAGAVGATGTGTGALGNGTLGTAAPSAQPYTGAAVPGFGSSIPLYMFISVAFAMMFV